jgi:hypothetical protein
MTAARDYCANHIGASTLSALARTAGLAVVPSPDFLQSALKLRNQLRPVRIPSMGEKQLEQRQNVGLDFVGREGGSARFRSDRGGSAAGPERGEDWVDSMVFVGAMRAREACVAGEYISCGSALQCGVPFSALVEANLVNETTPSLISIGYLALPSTMPASS